jgi:hypothetical protein
MDTVTLCDDSSTHASLECEQLPSQQTLKRKRISRTVNKRLTIPPFHECENATNTSVAESHVSPSCPVTNESILLHNARMRLSRRLFEKCVENVFVPHVQTLVAKVFACCDDLIHSKMSLCFPEPLNIDIPVPIESVEDALVAFFEQHELEKVSSMKCTGTVLDDSKKLSAVVQIPCSICTLKTQWYCKGCTLDDPHLNPVAVCGYHNGRKCYKSHVKMSIRGHLKSYLIAKHFDEQYQSHHLGNDT